MTPYLSWRRWRGSWSARSRLWPRQPAWPSRRARPSASAQAVRERWQPTSGAQRGCVRTGMRLALCQMNATVGDLPGNARRILEGIEAAKQTGAELVLFPELALTGYPPEDLLLREHFLQDTGTQLERLAAAAEGIGAIVGFPERIPNAVRGPEPGSPGPIATVLYNAAAVLAGGAVAQVYRKVHLPNYGVFDEQRYFKSGDPGGTVIELASLAVSVGQQEGSELETEVGQRIGVTVCEDL